MVKMLSSFVAVKQRIIDVVTLFKEGGGDGGNCKKVYLFLFFYNGQAKTAYYIPVWFTLFQFNTIYSIFNFCYCAYFYAIADIIRCDSCLLTNVLKLYFVPQISQFTSVLCKILVLIYISFFLQFPKTAPLWWKLFETLMIKNNLWNLN